MEKSFSSNDKIGIGIIGAGKVSHLHAQAIAQIPGAKLLAVCSRNIEKASDFSAKYNVRAYTDIDEMTRHSGLDMVIICTPHPAHAAPAIKAAEAKLHILVEKPLASGLADCDAMIGAASVNNVILGMVCQRRFYPPVQRVRNAIDEGRIGDPIIGLVHMLGWRDEAYYKSDSWRGTWDGEGGGVLVNQAPHQIDLLQWFMGPVDTLYGCRANLNHPYIEVEDTAMAVIKFKSGALGSILVSNSQNPALFGKVHVFGSNGAGAGVQTDGGAMFIAGMSNITEPPVNDLWAIKGEEDMLEKWKVEDTVFFNSIDPMIYFHMKQDEDFVNAIRERKSPLIDGKEGRKTVEIFTAVYRSERDSLPVKFPLAPEKERNDFDGRLSENSK